MRGCSDAARRTLLLCAVASSLSSGVIACNRQSPSLAVSRALLDHLEEEQFGIVTSLRGLPLGVREALQALFASQWLDIAEPDEEFQAAGASVRSRVPSRRLVLAGCSNDHCLVYYERAATTNTWHATLFNWTPAETRFEWGGDARGGLTDIDDVRKALLAGDIKAPSTPW